MCQNCPNNVPEHSVPFTILYSGGPPQKQYRALRQVIPPRDPNLALPYGWPSITDDGCIQYAGGHEPPVPEGWERAAPMVFRPVWPTCQSRALRAQVMEDGRLRVEGVCFHPATRELFNQVVTLAACHRCSHRRPIE